MSKRQLLSSPSLGTTARASSVLKRNTKLYGPMNALDTTDEVSCWNSDAVPSGTSSSDAGPITFTIHFGPNRTVEIDEIRIQFQGGFVAEECTACLSRGGGEDWVEMEEPIEPEDVNDMQAFAIADADRTCNMLRLSFEGSSDFYGRVTIYKLEVWGSEA
mmetsp:Transcript_115/g.301  ORF Transcript_115/g.301 Transcript_115/m.301 type:complete len:160 (+) Transcript_115:199-678(+)